MSKRVGIYIRISTPDQHSHMQRDELLAFCHARGWVMAEIYEDQMTGTHANRPEFQRLLRHARQRKIDILLCWKLDRCFRSLKDMVNTIQELGELGIEFASLRDNIDMTTASGRLMAHLLAAFGEFEAALCRERVRAGLDAAKRRGKKLGRPRTIDDTKIKELRASGQTYSQIGNALNISPGSISLALKK
ncbi:MAG: recombinase family protein [Bdellovibrionales bacterium]